jgi:cell division septation protein DedD
MRNPGKNQIGLYIKPAKHAPFRVLCTYGLFISALIGIAFGAGHFLRQLSRSDYSNVGSSAISDQIPNAKAIEQRLDTPNITVPSSDLNAMNEHRIRDGVNDENPDIPVWFYAEIGLSPRPGLTEAATASDPKFTLLIFSSPNLKEAQQRRELLAKQGLHAFVQKSMTEKGQAKFKVQIGVFKSKRRAASERSRLAKKYDIKSEVENLEL